MAVDHHFAPRVEMSRVPAAIFALIHCQPAKRGLNRCFCLAPGASRESSIDASFATTTLLAAWYAPPMRDASGAKFRAGLRTVFRHGGELAVVLWNGIQALTVS